MLNYSHTDILKNSDGSQTAADETEMYDKVLLCTICNPNLNNNITQEASKEKKELKQNESPADLKGLLTQSAEAVASSDMKTADELIKKIRQHTSPYGDGAERLAHYFANAIEACLAGTEMALYTASTTKRVMVADTLKAYHAYITACPFHKMSYIFANKTMCKLASRAKSLHIIDFGISYGFQWPSLIQCLSMREGGPPRLRITGIDHPEPGRSPAERVEDSGRRLANYCQRFNVPFEYNAIAKKWENITIEDLKIDRGQMIVVNSLYRLRDVPDETVVASSPRDTVLNLVKRMDPDLFIHGVVNGTFNSPFFNTRFRDALSHFSTMFDILEATTERWDKGRMMFEREVFGREVMNIIACEGEGRIERPETYKQWEDRNQRAGFKQMPLCWDIVKEVSEKIGQQYHKDFVVEEDSNWMLQGWKGQFIYALSCWKPVQD